MISHLHVEGYRSIRKLRLDLGAVNVVLGPNGSGKTNLYRALYLLAEAAHGRFARALADEGGMPSALWAGTRRKGPVRMVFGATIDAFTYELACGLPQAVGMGRFTLDPRVKEESATFFDGKRSTPLLQRENVTTWLRDADGVRVSYPIALRDAESVLSQLQDPQRYPVVASLASELRSWRFYHHFRTDHESPLRQPQVGIQTPVLSSDGTDLAAALETIFQIGDSQALNEELERAFPGAKLEIDVREGEARFAVQMTMPGITRPLRAAELSDGTLRYLCLLAALLSPRPPTFLALNEPETSLHPDLLEPLAHLVARAGKTSQICLTTHAEQLGMRASEIADRIVRDLDGGGRILAVTAAKTAAGVRRLRVPALLQPLLQALASGKEPSDRLFGGGANRHWVLRSVARVCTMASVPAVTPHGLRGTHATLAVGAGISGDAVAASLGHESFAVTAAHYAQPEAVSGAKAAKVADTLG